MVTIILDAERHASALQRGDNLCEVVEGILVVDFKRDVAFHVS